MGTAEALRPNLMAEPQRLLNQREYRAAVVSAITLLESRLRQVAEVDEDSRGRLLAIGRIAELALKRGLVTQDEYPELRHWIAVRNSAVHSEHPVTARVAKQVVAGVQQILERL